MIKNTLLVMTGITSQESSRVPPTLDTDQLRKNKCRNRTSAVKRRASASSDTQPTERLSIHSPNYIPYLNYVNFIPLDSRANVLLSFLYIQQKSLQLCEAYFSNKIVFGASAGRDGYSEKDIHEDPYFHKCIRPLTDNDTGKVLTGTNCTNSGTEGVKRKYPPPPLIIGTTHSLKINILVLY